MTQRLEELGGCIVLVAVMCAVFLLAHLLMRRRDGRWPGQATPEI